MKRDCKASESERRVATIAAGAAHAGLPTAPAAPDGGAVSGPAVAETEAGRNRSESEKSSRSVQRVPMVKSGGRKSE